MFSDGKRYLTLYDTSSNTEDIMYTPKFATGVFSLTTQYGLIKSGEHIIRISVVNEDNQEKVFISEMTVANGHDTSETPWTSFTQRIDMVAGDRV